MFKESTALVALLISVIAVASASAAKDKADEGPATPKEASAALQETVNAAGVFEHLKAFQRIADKNGDNRAAGTKGYDASAKYVQGELEDYGWDVKRQSFRFDAFFEDAPPVFERTAPNPRVFVEETEFATMEFSASGDATAELVAIDLQLPPPAQSGSTSGCEAADFPASVSGKIALIQRGTCDFVDKVKNAAAAGAVGAVLFNEGQEGRTDVIFGTLGESVTIPAVDTSFAIGQELANGATSGPTGVTVHVKTTTRVENLKTTNVVADSPSGGKNVVMARAHLDSVPEGPGMNDNGSGSAVLLELARQMSELKLETKNTVRLAWWGAEETGLNGSTEYVAGLSKKEARKIALYLNFDMVGSPNFARLVYDGDGSAFDEAGPKGSDAIEKTFAKHFKRADLASGETAFDGRSDYLAFIDVGIPSGGLFTGGEEIKTAKEAKLYGGKAGKALDPCYHQACDDLDNVSRKAITQMSDAVADSVARYAMDLGPLTGKGKGKGGKGNDRVAPPIVPEYRGSHLTR